MSVRAGCSDRTEPGLYLRPVPWPFTLIFFTLNGSFQLVLSNSMGDKHIKDTLQVLENILGNRNSRALRGELEREWHVSQSLRLTGWNLIERRICLFFHLATTLNLCSPRSELWCSALLAIEEIRLCLEWWISCGVGEAELLQKWPK